MTFSDFGRRANANASAGTDHGVAAPQFMFGTAMKYRTLGQNANLSDLVVSYGNNKDINMRVDFRRIYADILNDWFSAGQPKTDSLLLHNFPTLSIFSDVCETVASGAWTNPATWTIGRAPTASENIRVNAGHVVTLAQNTTVRSVKLYGKIAYSPGVRLRVTG